MKYIIALFATFFTLDGCYLLLTCFSLDGSLNSYGKGLFTAGTLLLIMGAVFFWFLFKKSKQH